MKQTVIALGMFDGVHLGHRALLHRAVGIARQNGDVSAAFTYTNHPRELFGGSFSYLSDAAQRELMICSLGIDRVDAVPFTKAFSELSPESFLQWLSNRYNGRISAVVCGYDYRFGRGAQGDESTLRTLGGQYGFAVEVLPPVLYEDAPCSSTRVRQALADGGIEQANAMLARPYAITGRVVHNKAIGRTFGFPTANVDPRQMLLPKDGVYASALLADGAAYAGVTNIGSNPTVGGNARTLETYAIDETLSLYGKTVTVLFLKRIRDEIRFPSTEELALQIDADAHAAKKVYEESKKGVYKTASLW